MGLFTRLLKRTGMIIIAAECLVVAGAVVALLFYKPVPMQELAHKSDSTPPAWTKLSVTEKAGRLVCMAVNSRSLAVQIAQDYHVGCFLLTPGGDVYDREVSSAIESVFGTSVFLAIDEEGGSVARLDNARFSDDSAQNMAALPDMRVQDLGLAMGRSIRSVGANLDFAPVLDIDDGTNEAIGYYGRAFSDDPDAITHKAGAFATGLRNAGVVPTYKHFPGLGRATGETNGNTDTGSATAPDLASLSGVDLIPYKNLLPGKGPTAVMTGNQIVPGLTDGQPASISSATYSLLRSKYRFTGVVFTDSLSAASIMEPAPQAVADALKAGADLPLVTVYSADEAGSIISAILNAVGDGSLNEGRVNGSLARIESLRETLPKD